MIDVFMRCSAKISRLSRPVFGFLIPNPIHKVLSTFQSCGVRALLMGGQACVFYGAAEFSRDTDSSKYISGCGRRARRIS